MLWRGASDTATLKEAVPRGSLWVLYVVEQVLMICKVAVGGCARQLQREIVRFEAAGRGWREGWQGILGQRRRRDSVRAGTNENVSCIDDHPLLLEHRRSTLEILGYRVRIATNGHAAIKILEETSADAVLLEYRLEGIDAEAVAYQIKQRFPRLPIILLSAYFDMPERILWVVDEHLMKSELPEGLRRVIERVTVRPKANKERRTA